MKTAYYIYQPHGYGPGHSRVIRVSTALDAIAYRVLESRGIGMRVPSKGLNAGAIARAWSAYDTLFALDAANRLGEMAGIASRQTLTA